MRAEPFRQPRRAAARRAGAARRPARLPSAELALRAVPGARLHAPATSTASSARSRACAAARRCSCSGRRRRRRPGRRCRSSPGQQAALAQAGAGVLAVALDASARTRRRSRGRRARRSRACPWRSAPTRSGATYALLNRYLFVTKDDLRLPTHVPAERRRARSSRLYREPDRRRGRARRPSEDRRLRPGRAPGPRHARSRARSTRRPGQRNYLQYGLELVEQGFESAGARPPSSARRKGDPSAFTLYSLGTLYMKSGQTAKAQAAFERALEVKPDFAEASNGLGALLAQGGNLPARDRALQDRARDHARTTRTPSTTSATPSSRWAATARRFDLYQKALALQPDFPEAFNNLGIYYARQGDPPRAEASLQAGGGEASRLRRGRATTSRSCSWPGRTWRAPTAVLQRLLAGEPRLRDDLRDAGQGLPEHRPRARGRCRCSSGCCSGTRRTRSPSRWFGSCGPADEGARRRPCVARPPAGPAEQSPGSRADEPHRLFTTGPSGGCRLRSSPSCATSPPGGDAFPEEKDAEELGGAARRAGPAALRARAPRRRSRGSVGSGLQGQAASCPAEEKHGHASPSFEVAPHARDAAGPGPRPRRRSAGARGLRPRASDAVRVAEFLITSIETRERAASARAPRCGYDLVGAAPARRRAQRDGPLADRLAARAGRRVAVTRWIGARRRRAAAPRRPSSPR